MGSVAPGEAPATGSLRVSTRVPTAVGTDAAAVHAGNDLQINTDAITGTTAEPKVAAQLQAHDDVLPAQAGQDNATYDPERDRALQGQSALDLRQHDPCGARVRRPSGTTARTA